MSKRARILLIVAIVVVLVALAIPRWLHSRDLTSRLICGTNVRGLAASLKIYAESWSIDDRDPAATLIAKGLMPTGSGVCPVSGQPYRINRAYFADSNGFGDQRSIVVHEDLSNHGVGANVCYGDGHATFERAEDFKRMLVEHGLSE